jgi:hypothetical protein
MMRTTHKRTNRLVCPSPWLASGFVLLVSARFGLAAEPQKAAEDTAASPLSLSSVRQDELEKSEQNAERTDVVPRLAIPDSVVLEAHSSTYIPLFQRALLPGPAGAVSHTSTMLPVYEYLMLRLIDADVPWAKNSVDAELSLWGAGSIVGKDIDGRGGERYLDGDVSVASITHRYGPGYVKLGRQYVSGGAARYAHLDGISGSYRADWGGIATAYAGYTALPRWYDVPNYRLLGSTADAMVVRPEDLPHGSRNGNWMAGGRVGYSHLRYGELGASIHEQRENGALGRRDLAFDVRLPTVKSINGDARAIFDLDSGMLADAFFGLSWHPTNPLDVSVDYRRMTPTLLMSRQSVLSVFTVDRFDELGGEVRYRFDRRVVGFLGSYVEWFESGDVGSRVRTGVRVIPDDRHRVLVNASYTRVTEPLNGYHGTRLSVGYRFDVPLQLTAEQYLYLYEHAIRGMNASSVHALNGSYRVAQAWDVMLGGSLFNSPYAAMDAQAMFRLTYTVGSVLGGEP